jgi:redox-regulated HSP33 family molecular chaperone
VRAAIAEPRASAAQDGPLLADGFLEVTRIARDGAPYRSSLLYSGGGVEAAVTEYLVRSEQIVAVVHLEVGIAHCHVDFTAGCPWCSHAGGHARADRPAHVESLPPLSRA